MISRSGRAGIGFLSDRSNRGRINQFNRANRPFRMAVICSKPMVFVQTYGYVIEEFGSQCYKFIIDFLT
jgi:hypothetical protein